jgi:glycosyltransferase involved in cell wall biosynthesis
MEKALFVSNQVFFDQSKPEGGVRLCTNDFIRLIECRFEVIRFPLQYNRSFWYRVRAKAGLDIFEDYHGSDYAPALFEQLERFKISKVFINLANASRVAEVIKKRYGAAVKTIICSHGNESGDFLHQTVRFREFMPWLQRQTAAWRLGKVLQAELTFRLHAIDLVLAVSGIEESIENWLGAKKVFYVPRVFQPHYIKWEPVQGKVGFIGDVSHYPNYYGMLTLCEELIKKPIPENFEICIVGRACTNLDLLKSRFPFIRHTGYLDEPELIKEAGTWMYYLNLVFYYSKGVSTKLAKGMNWGIPVISTTAGNRGYIFKNGGVVTIDGPVGLANAILQKAFDKDEAKRDAENVKLAVQSFADMNEVMNNLYPVLQSL